MAKTSQYVLKARRDMRLSRNDLGIVILNVKQRIRKEPNAMKRLMWAEIGLELNMMYLEIKPE